MLFVFQSSLGCFAQIGVGQWRDHLPFTFEKHITQSSNKIFAATDYGVLIYTKSTKSIEKLTKVNGLSDIGISAIAYSSDNNVLFIGYNNGNIDLINGKDIFNISDIKRKIITGSKSINNVIFINEFAIISCGFGVVVLNLEKQEIKDSYYIGNFGGLLNINQIAFDGQYLYAATSQGIYKGDYLYSNLADFNNWILQTTIPNYSGNFNAITKLDNKIIANNSIPGSNDIAYLLNNEIWTVFSSDFDEIRKVKYSNNRLLLAADKRLVIYDQNLNFTDSIQTNDYTNPNISDALIDNNNTIWITDLGNGLIKHSGTNFEFIFPNAPYTSDAFSFDIKNKRVLVAGGGIGQTGSNVFINGTVHSFQNQQWRKYY
ncbi:MAG: hypothetical protein MZV63_44580 [Marinilabiliales bacterium]|nr:hypothetical protein [Marinilabiliales bacterium]